MSHTGIFGMTESGKSHLLKNELLPAWSSGPIVSADVNDELSRHGTEKPNRKLGPLRERCTASKLAAFPSKLLEPDLSLAVVPDVHGNVASEAACWDLIAQLLISYAPLFAQRHHNVKFINGECGPYFRRLTAPQRERLLVLATRGVTHLNIDCVYETQCPSLVDINVRRNIANVYYFKLPEAADIDTVREKAGKQFAERVRRLPLREHLVWRATAPTDVPAPEPEKEQVAT